MIRGALLLWLIWGVAGAWAAVQHEAVDFNFQVRPLLSDRCFKCHGPDEKSRKAKLRLDGPEGAYAVRDAATGRRPVVPGHPERSEVIRRITSTDPDDLMPPKESKLELSKEERELIRKWISQGGEYQKHWAFNPVRRVRMPAGSSRGGKTNPIDALVGDTLRREGLTASPEAEREVLIRRLSFDLTGLPPTLVEIDAFLADRSKEAYERVVDRLLASPAYGERRANEWLDLARYADTYGYQNDVERDLSPWRDWVIRAFNENLPYDQFIMWQLAGDLLPNATRDQVLATAFNRLHRQTNEGGSIDEEFRVEYVSDRVHTAGTAFLGVTFECARCHDHKYDPFTQRDYYRLSGFFNNIDESGLYAHFTTATPSPTLLLYTPEAEASHRAAEAEVAGKASELERRAGEGMRGFEAWLKGDGKRAVRPQPADLYEFESIQDNQTPDSCRTNRSASLVDNPVQVEGRVGRALQFSGDNGMVCKGVGAFGRTDPFSISLWLKPTERGERAVVFHRSRAWSDSGSRGYELVLEQGRPAFGLIHFWPGNALKIRGLQELSTNEWTQVTVTYDGSSRAQGTHLYLNGAAAGVEVVRDNLFKDILHRAEWGDADVGGVELTLSSRFRDSGFRNGMIDQFAVFDRCLTPVEVQAWAGLPVENLDREALLAYYLDRVDPGYRAALSELREAREKENRIINDVREIMVMKEMPDRRPTYVLKRGSYEARGEAVTPGVPEAILPWRRDYPTNRLGLARWITNPENPLTARVAVNRVWATHFGRGLVATPENFGSQGQLPTHPQLLDWLASEFVRTGWDLKRLHKLVVMSATYRRSSVATPEQLAKDPENRYLARGPKHRLQAEQIRDEALSVSGLLSGKIGGPSARPYQPAGLWEEAGTGKSYTADHGEGLYRRSLYTFWKRTAPPPTMLTFDATSREVCTARRGTTATPLQALVLLNDPQFVEAARVLAEDLVRMYPAEVDSRIRRAFRKVTSRSPLDQESRILRRLYDEQLALFSGDVRLADKYLLIGEHPHDGSLAAAEVAATAVMVNAVMNLDEFVTQR